jgi:hypothetical protein
MATATFTVNPAQAPAGATCRLYNTDDWSFVSECISDGSGTLVFTVSGNIFRRTLVRVFPADAPGEFDMFPSAISVV